jgi:hypothetical protein
MAAGLKVVMERELRRGKGGARGGGGDKPVKQIQMNMNPI